MDCFVYYTYRGKASAASAFFSFEEDPYYIFLWLHDPVHVSAFGNEISIKTDLAKVLPKKNDYNGLVELESILFAALQQEPSFIAAKTKKLGKII